MLSTGHHGGRLQAGVEVSPSVLISRLAYSPLCLVLLKDTRPLSIRHHQEAAAMQRAASCLLDPLGRAQRAPQTLHPPAAWWSLPAGLPRRAPVRYESVQKAEKLEEQAAAFYLTGDSTRAAATSGQAVRSRQAPHLCCDLPHQAPGAGVQAPQHLQLTSLHIHLQPTKSHAEGQRANTEWAGRQAGPQGGNCGL